MAPRQEPKSPVASAIQVAQLIALLIGVAMIAVDIGRRDATLTRISQDTGELRAICAELSKIQARTVATEENHSAAIEKLAAKIDRMSNHNKGE